MYLFYIGKSQYNSSIFQRVFYANFFLLILVCAVIQGAFILRMCLTYVNMFMGLFLPPVSEQCGGHDYVYNNEIFIFCPISFI
jgi:hypothetical protein